MEVLHKFAQPQIIHMPILKPCSFVGLIKPYQLLTGLFWDAVDSFAGLFDGLYYICTGESTSKADKLNNFRSIKILNTPFYTKETWNPK